MKIVSKIKTGLIGLGAMVATQLAMAQSFNNIPTNGPTLGKMSKNVSNSLVDGASALEAFLYLMGIVFMVLFIFTLVKWKKSDGREGNMGLIAVYLIACVCCLAAPTLMGSGIVTIFGNTGVQTVKPPQPSFGN